MALTAEQADFITSGVSINVASRDRRRVPSLNRVLACRVSADRRAVTLLVPGAASAQLLADIAACGAVAAVFSQPASHRTIQLKGSDARVGPAAPGDADLVARHRDAFARGLIPLGYTREWSLAVHEAMPGDLAAITFTVDVAYAQTPGPGAGARLADDA